MSNLPVDPYNRGYIVEPPIDNPDRAPLGGTGKDFVVTLSDNFETPGADMMFLSRSGKWVPFKTTDLVTWGSIAGDITQQADLMAMFAQYTPTTEYARVAFTGNYNDLTNLPPLGTVSPLDLDGSTSRFLRGDGTWAIPVDVNAQWGNISGNINAQTDLINLLNLKAPITNPTFQGLVNIPTPPVDDNSTLAINSAWFFGQAFNGTPQMDGVASSGNSTLWARGNHRHPTDTTKIGDAPNDGKQYARQSQTWTVVSSSGGGGGGGVWIGDLPPSDTTSYPFWWSSASLQLSIWYNDGNSSQWVDTNAQPGAPTGPWLLQDGTVAAPGLAWASEPGLGWYRYAAGIRAFAKSGFRVETLDASVPTTTNFSLSTQAAGVSAISMSGFPPGAANSNSLSIQAGATGYTIAEVLNGTATTKTLTMMFAGGLRFTSPTGNAVFILDKAGSGNESDLVFTNAGTARWRVLGGDGAAEAGSNTGSNFYIQGCNDAGAVINAPFMITRSSGLVTFGNDASMAAGALVLRPTNQLNGLQASLSNVTTLSLLSGQSMAFSGSGMLLVNLPTNGLIGLFLMGAGGTFFIGGAAGFYGTTSASSVYLTFTSPNYYLVNNSGVTHSFTVIWIKTRDTA